MSGGKPSGGGGAGAAPEPVPREAWVALIAMTLAASLILVDQTAVPIATPEAIRDLGGSVDEGTWILTANILPLAAFMVLGGRLGDLFGMRRMFLLGTVIFLGATLMAGLAQNMAWMLGARATQGMGAALMMPTGIAIVSAVFPASRRGTGLGVLAGGSAAFAAAGPILGGALTTIDWRMVFMINVPLAALAIAMTLRAVPDERPTAPGSLRGLDFPGVIVLALSAAGILFGLSQVQQVGLDEVIAWAPLAGGLAGLVLFAVIELRTKDPLLDLRLFRRLNFLASNLSQMIAGMIELGLGFLMPFFLLLVIGLEPALAGLALLPATIPVVLAGPLAGRFYDRYGGRIPMSVGFAILAGSGVALAIGADEQTVLALAPGLALQGLGLGIVLTVNDPVGINAVERKDAGTAAGMINTSEQLGGALGIAVLVMIEFGYYKDRLYERLAADGITPSEQDVEDVKELILEAEQAGIQQIDVPARYEQAVSETIPSHVDGFQAAFVVSAVLGLLGMVMALVLVRREDRIAKGPIFGRRSRWLLSNVAATPALSRKPPPED